MSSESQLGPAKVASTSSPSLKLISLKSHWSKITPEKVPYKPSSRKYHGWPPRSVTPITPVIRLTAVPHMKRPGSAQISTLGKSSSRRALICFSISFKLKRTFGSGIGNPPPMSKMRSCIPAAAASSKISRARSSAVRYGSALIVWLPTWKQTPAASRPAACAACSSSIARSRPTPNFLFRST